MRKVYRLQAIGGSYYIALPKEWLKRFGLGKGSHVEVVVEDDGTLRIKPIEIQEEVQEELSKIEVEVQERETLFSLLITLYLRGYDIISLRFKGSAIASTIRDAVNRAKNILLGFEIVDEDSFSIVLQVLSSSDTEIHTLIKNMCRIARSMYLDSIVALIERDAEKAYSVEARDQDLNRLYFYITRVIRKKVISGIVEPKELLKLVDLRMAVKAVEEIGDDAKRVAKIVQEVILNDIEIDINNIERLKMYVDELDEIYRNTMNKIEKVVPLPELLESLYRCEKIRTELSNFRKDLVEKDPKALTLLSEVIYSYEDIATHVYDIISLIYSSI
uniref:Phosphate uptake regulator PhoU n=1 Tax=Ignisphaera aggregans TaxID=334771 RepID=A0A7C4D3T6_9CREN